MLKTKSSFRTLPLIPMVEELLLQEKQKQETYRKLFRKSYCLVYLDYICLDKMGKYDLKKICFHNLMHICASLLLANESP